MHKIIHLRLPSVAWLFAVLYGMVGLYASIRSVLEHEKSILCPLGLDFAMCRFTINVTLDINGDQAQTWLRVPVSVAFFVLTGAISGATAALLYNLTSPIWGGISGRVSATPASSQSNQGIGLI